MSTRVVLPALGGSGLALAIGWGFMAGNGSEQLSALLAMPWGVVTLLDLYLGFALFLGWVWHRERHALRFLAWVVAVCLAGNVAACIYVVLAALAAGGEEKVFWHGETQPGPGTGGAVAAGGAGGG